MARVEQFLHPVETEALLALRNVILRVDEVVDDRVRIRPQLEQIVALEERVVPVGRVRDDERLHRHRVLFHQIRDAGVRIDDDFIRQPHLAATVALFRGQEVLAERPVPVVHRHADGRVRVHHLFGADEFELDRIDVELILLCNMRNMRCRILRSVRRSSRTGTAKAVFRLRSYGLPFARSVGVPVCPVLQLRRLLPRQWLCSGRCASACPDFCFGTPFCAPADSRALRCADARVVMTDATCFSNSSRNTG